MMTADGSSSGGKPAASAGFTGRLKGAWRVSAPAWLRRSRFAEALKRAWIACLPHNAVYDRDYYENAVEAAAAAGAGAIAASICTHLRPRTLLDVGCGSGALLEWVKGRGVEVRGLELSEAALELCRARGLNVERFDLEKDVLEDPRRYDVVVSMEVAEHLPERVADRYIELLCRVAPRIVFTAAPPGQGGTDHVNEKPREYWVTRFERKGFRAQPELEKRWRDDWRRAGVVGWYWQNLMILMAREADAPGAGEQR